MGSGTESVSSSLSTGSTVVSAVSRSSRSRERLSITSTLLNGRNYAVWAKAVEVYYVGESEYHYLTDDPPAATAASYGAWVPADAKIRVELWNSMEENIKNTLVFLSTAKKVWMKVKEMFSGANNLRRTYALHQQFFSLELGSLSLEEYYAKFCGVCEELNTCEPISSDIQVMERQRERLQVARFLFGLPSPAYDSIRSNLLGDRDLPSLSEVFSRVRQASISDPSAVDLTPIARSALVTTAPRGGTSSRGFDRRGPPGRGFSRDSGSSGSMQSIGGRDSGSGGRGRARGRGPRSCTYCHGTNHTVEYCWILHGRPSAHQVTVSEDDGSGLSSSATSHVPRVVTIPEDEYHRLMSQSSTHVPSSSTATFAQKGSTFAGLVSNNPWVIDSGATDHMTGHSIHLSGSRPLVKPSRVALADGSSSDIAGSPDGEEDWWRC